MRQSGITIVNVQDALQTDIDGSLFFRGKHHLERSTCNLDCKIMSVANVLWSGEQVAAPVLKLQITGANLRFHLLTSQVIVNGVLKREATAWHLHE